MNTVYPEKAVYPEKTGIIIFVPRKAARPPGDYFRQVETMPSSTDHLLP